MHKKFQSVKIPETKVVQSHTAAVIPGSALLPCIFDFHSLQLWG